MIECKGLTKYYGPEKSRTFALHDLTLTVNEGETLMIVGPSGSGKTTLLSIVAGLLTQDEGSCTTLGTDIAALPDSEKDDFRGQNIGFVFQAFNLVPTLSALENTAIPLLVRGTPEKEAYDAAHALLERLGLGDKLDSLPPDMSGGQQQRLSIARSCIHKPKLILCDEPTSSLDHKTGIAVMDLLKELQKETGCTLVIVTHDPRIFDYADRIETLEDGHISPGSSLPPASGGGGSSPAT
jgi:putative ABC transport system ATP-binding protein